MATATAVQEGPAHGGPMTRPNMVSVGTIVWLSSELMFFAALFAMYFTVRSVNVGEWPPDGIELEVPYSAIFTIILVLSSVTCQFGVFAAERGRAHRLGNIAAFWKWGMREWFALTFLMGLVFVIGQGNEYINRNTFTPKTNGYGSVYYITTGFHGLHVCGGLVAFLIVLARSYFGKFTPEKATSSIVVSYYWHFVDVVWIALYSVIYLIQ